MTQAAQDLAFQKDYLERYEAAKEYSKRLTAPSLVERFVALPEASRVRILGQLSKVELAALMYAWESWARAKQHPKLDDNIRVLLFLGGRGGGKTVAGAQFKSRFRECSADGGGARPEAVLLAVNFRHNRPGALDSDA